MKQHYDVAAYLWPSYHYEPRVEHFWPEKDGEWYTVRRGTPRFPEHDMPRIPLLGYQDEADPKVMRQHLEQALAHGFGYVNAVREVFGQGPFPPNVAPTPSQNARLDTLFPHGDW